MSGIKYIIGVDPSLRNFAFSVHDNMGMALETDVIRTRAGMNDHDSVDDIVEGFFERLDKYLEIPDAVVVYFEDIIFAQKGKGTARAEATGVVKWNLRQQGVRIRGATNSQLNSFLFGLYGVVPAKSGRRATTKEIKQCTKDTLHRFRNFYTRSDDMADAYAAAMFGYAHAIEKKRFSVRALSRQ